MKLSNLEEKHLGELVSLWNRELGGDFPMNEKLFRQNSLQDENILAEGSKTAIAEDGKIAGFVISKWVQPGSLLPEGKTGWIQVLLVDSDYRGKGIGSLLLKTAEQALISKGAEKILLGGDPWHYFPGIPAEYESVREWFGYKGFKGDEIVEDLVCDLQSIETISNPMVTVLTQEEKEEFLSFLKVHFPGRWTYEANVYFDRGGTGREFAVIKKDSKIIGFIRMNDAVSPVIGPNAAWASLFTAPAGGIGPLAIIESERGNGYGLSIVEAALHIHKERGNEHVVIDWTEKGDFYRKAGAKTWKLYATLSKTDMTGSVD